MASRVRPLKRRPLEHSPRHLATTMPFCRSASCSERFRPVSTSAAGPSIAAGRKALARRSAGGVRGSSSIPIVSGELLRNVSAFPADAVERKIKISLIEFNSRLVAARGHNHRQHRKNVDIGRGTRRGRVAHSGSDSADQRRGCRAVRVGARAERRTRSDDGRHDHDEPAASSRSRAGRARRRDRSGRVLGVNWGRFAYLPTISFSYITVNPVSFPGKHPPLRPRPRPQRSTEPDPYTHKK